MKTASATSFERLMSEVAAGSEDAIWQLAETYTPYIIRAARASLPPMVRRRVDSHDVAQMLWTSLLLGRQDMARLKTPEELIAYLARAARNKAIDAIRQQTKTQKYEMSREINLADVNIERENLSSRANAQMYARDPSPSEFAMLRERWQHFLAKASKRDRQILELRLKRQSFEAIGRELELNPATVRRAIVRLIGQLSK